MTDRPTPAIPIESRRRRAFVAMAPVPPAPLPVHSPLPAEEDIPVLTEIVPPDLATPPEDVPATTVDEALLAVLSADLAHAIEQQLAAELPTLLEATLANVSHELRIGIADTIDLAVRNFIAHRQQLCLPLDEPGSQD